MKKYISLFLICFTCYVHADELSDLYNQAVKLNEEKRYEEAVELLIKRAKLAPDDPWVQYHAGVNLYWNLKMYKEALPYYQKAMELLPDEPLFVEEMADIYFNLKDYAMMRTLDDKALSMYGDKKIDYWKLRRMITHAVYREPPDIEYADLLYKRIMNQDYSMENKKDAGVDIAWGYYNRIGWEYIEKKEYEKAYDAFKISLHYVKDNSLLYRNAGLMLLYYLDNPKEAVSVYDTALSLEPSEMYIVSEAIDASRKCNNFEKMKELYTNYAIPLYKRSLVQYKNDSEKLYQELFYFISISNIFEDLEYILDAYEKLELSPEIIKTCNMQYVMYNSILFLQREGLLALTNNNIKDGEKCFELAMRLYGLFEPDNKYCIDIGGLKVYKEEIQLYKDAGYFWNKNKSKRRTAYPFKFTVLFLNKVKLTVKVEDGTKTRIESDYSNSPEQFFSNRMECVRRIYFYYSNGMLLPEYTIIKVDSTLTKIDGVLWENKVDGTVTERYYSQVPDLTGIIPYPSKIYKETIHNTDSYVLCIPASGNGGLGYWRKILLDIPGTYSTKTIPDFIIFDDYLRAANELVIFHELFHGIQAAYWQSPGELSMAHQYLPQYKSNWPGWYNGEGELIFYKGAFGNVMSKDKFQTLHFRE